MPNTNQVVGPEKRITELGLVLPEAPKPVAAYVPFCLSGGLLFVAGQIPMRNGSLIAKGQVGGDVDLETGIVCARQCALNGMAVMRAGVAAAGLEGGLDRVRRVVRVGCFVSCGAGFTDHPKVANGASELLVEVFGERGRHARAAVGAPSLPLGAPVEVEFTVEIG